MNKEVLDRKLNIIKLNEKLDKLKKKVGFIVQSLLFPKDKFSLNDAKKWAKERGYKTNIIDNGEGKGFFHLTQSKKKYDNFKTIHFKKSGVKARIATSSTKFKDGKISLKGFSKFSENIKSDLDIKIPMAIELQVLCEGKNRDGIIKREDLESSLELWKNKNIIDFHDESPTPTKYKMSDVKGHTLDDVQLKRIDGKWWIIAEGELFNRDLAYAVYLSEMRNKPLEISAEFGWTKYYDTEGVRQTNINPHMISIIERGHIKGNNIKILSV